MENDDKVIPLKSHATVRLFRMKSHTHVIKRVHFCRRHFLRSDIQAYIQTPPVDNGLFFQCLLIIVELRSLKADVYVEFYF